MARLKILAEGNSTQARANARGKLFEEIMARVLRHYGYKIDHLANVNYSGMEIDIEGRAIATGLPLYAECKCYEKEVDAPQLQSFFGKYMTKWFKNNRSQGLFIALPGVNSHAKGFYRDNCESNNDITVRLYEEDQIIDAILDVPGTANPNSIGKNISHDLGTPGDWIILYTDKGLFWIQYIIAPGAGIPTKLIFFDKGGKTISDSNTIEYLTQLYPELADFERINFEPTALLKPSKDLHELEEIVEVRGSSECFEYQFPSSPQYFVGRKSILKEIDYFVEKILNKSSSSRGMLFEANSGWGKSSVILAATARLKDKGHFAVAIDSRSASSSQFILRVIDYVFDKLDNFNDIIPGERFPITITGFDGAVSALKDFGRMLEMKRKILFIFLDQFENIFYHPETLKIISDLLLKLCDSQTNVVLGFSWKTDLIGVHSEFPYKLRDLIKDSSVIIPLKPFSETETTELLDRLSNELHTSLRSDLKFLLSEFSQGYPWLLKKLCAHVKAQVDAGVRQSDIANHLLNVKELFQEDLNGLSPEEEDTLRRIAKQAPINISDLGEDFSPEIVQTLVHRRLIVRIANKYDVYWDIFRDYLNTGSIPVQENYILRQQIGSVLKAIKLLSIASGYQLSTSEFQNQAGLSEKSYYNVIRDLKLLGLAKIEDETVIMQLAHSVDEKKQEDLLRNHLKERLRGNRLAREILKPVELGELLTIDQISEILAESCPYISASKQTWKLYARIIADWIDFADLAVFNKEMGTLSPYISRIGGRKKFTTRTRRRSDSVAPTIQSKPIIDTAIGLFEAFKTNPTKDNSVDINLFRQRKYKSALTNLDDLGFIIRKRRSIIILPKLLEFVLNPEKRPYIYAEQALKLNIFYNFIEILWEYENTGVTLKELSLELRNRSGFVWKDSTAEWHAKIMLNWARYAELAPEIFLNGGIL
jgi:Restriction endonuclease